MKGTNFRFLLYIYLKLSIISLQVDVFIYSSDAYTSIYIKISIGFNSLSLLLCFSSNPTKFSAVSVHAMGYNSSCKSIIRRSHGCLWDGRCKMLYFRNSTQNPSLFLAYFKRSERWNVFEEHIFNLSIFCNWYDEKFWTHLSPFEKYALFSKQK